MKLLKFYQPSCIPCQSVESYLQDKGIIYDSVNVHESPEIASEYGVLGTPVTILLNDDGIEIQRSIGYRPEELEEMITHL